MCAEDLIRVVRSGGDPVVVLQEAVHTASVDEMAAAATGVGGYHAPATAEYLLARGTPPYTAFRADTTFYRDARAKGYRGSGGSARGGVWTFWMPFWGSKKFGIKIAPKRWSTEAEAASAAQQARVKAMTRFDRQLLTEFIRMVEKRMRFDAQAADRELRHLYGDDYARAAKQDAIAYAQGKSSAQLQRHPAALKRSEMTGVDAIDPETFQQLIDGLSGEDAIPELEKLAPAMTRAQKREAWHYIVSHIENRLDSGMDVPEWMERASERVSDWDIVTPGTR